MFIYWITDKDKLWQVQHEVNMEIKKRFENAKIDMAFPTQTVHIMNQKKK